MPDYIAAAGEQSGAAENKKALQGQAIRLLSIDILPGLKADDSYGAQAPH